MQSKAIFIYCSTYSNLLEISPLLLLSWESGYTEEGKSSGLLLHEESNSSKKKLSERESLGCPIMVATVRAKSLILGFVLGSSVGCPCKLHSELALSAEKKSDFLKISAYIPHSVYYVAPLRPQNLSIDP